MNRRNFFKLATATVAGFFLPRPKYHTGGIVEFGGPRHGGKFHNLQSFKGMPYMISVHETVFTDEQINLIHRVVKANASKIKNLA